jgi:hypothetical protein
MPIREEFPAEEKGGSIGPVATICEQWSSMKNLILRIREHLTAGNRERIGVNGEQPKIEKRVEIGS